MVSYLLGLLRKDEEDEERAEINTPDSLWGETGTVEKYSIILWCAMLLLRRKSALKRFHVSSSAKYTYRYSYTVSKGIFHFVVMC